MMILQKLARLQPRTRMAAVVASSLVFGLSVSSAAAIVGGEENAGPLKSRTVMVLAEGGSVCSGIVLAPDVVLTSGHCVSGEREIRVHFRDPSGEAILLETAEIATHAGYNARAIEVRTRSIDLALIRLPEALPALFQPVTLSTAKPPRVGTPVTALGWGASEEGNERTTGTFRAADLVTVEPHGPGKYLLLAVDSIGMGRRPGAGVCQGDSGGPIIKNDGAVIGVVTWASGLDEDRCGLYTQGVLIAPQRGFIDGTLNRWGRKVDWR